MINTPGWETAKEKFTAWWKRENTGRPLMRIQGVLDTYRKPERPRNPIDIHLDVGYLVDKAFRNARASRFLGEAFPSLDINIGPGSLAVYLGGKFQFSPDTVWYLETLRDIWEREILTFNPDNPWWKLHLERVEQAQLASNGNFLINIPDIVEGLDILAALRGPQNLLYDIMDEPHEVKKSLERLSQCYDPYYDLMYRLVKDPSGGSSYTSFCIWGPGRVAKIQCDISAMLSPEQFREFCLPYFRHQCSNLDQTMFHLDGPDALHHVDALMEIEQLDALQWTYGVGQLDGGDEKWFPLYDKVFAAGKGLWTHIGDGSFQRWYQVSDRLVKRYGTKGLFLVYPEMDWKSAESLMEKAKEVWGGH